MHQEVRWYSHRLKSLRSSYLSDYSRFLYHLIYDALFQKFPSQNLPQSCLELESAVCTD